MVGAMAATAGEPVGPFPPGADPGEYDKLRRRVLWTMPSGLYVVGSKAGTRENLMTLNWATQLSFDPKLVGISVEKTAHTYELIHEGQAFSLCIIDREDRAIVRKFVKPVDVAEFDTQRHATGAPVLSTSVAWLDCELRQELPTGGHVLCIGEVVASGFNKAEDTPVLRMEDTRMNYGG
jgi:flavin reductase (DIM6/NTAB) family NADH-FMN oxidoreductase RutF